MTYSIDDLKGEFGTGLARTSLWRVFLPSVDGAFGITTRRLNVLCKSAQLPFRQILTNQRIVGMKKSWTKNWGQKTRVGKYYTHVQS